MCNTVIREGRPIQQLQSLGWVSDLEKGWSTGEYFNINQWDPADYQPIQVWAAFSSSTSTNGNQQTVSQSEVTLRLKGADTNFSKEKPHFLTSCRTMAAAAQLGNLQEEATCSICLDYFTDPVMIDCGHNFCRSCITQSWEGRNGNFPCPQCRVTSSGKNLRPNRQLGNMVDMVKQFHLPPVKPQVENLCKKHENNLRLFCAEDQRMICWVCRESKEHKTYSASPVEKAAQKYKDKLTTEKQKIESEFEKRRQPLKENEQTLHRRLEGMEKKISLVENANIIKLSNRITSLNALITALEKKCEVPAWDLLKDIERTLSRCNNVKLQCLEAVKTSYKVMVTLDPDTSHPLLLLSEGGRRARRTGTAQPLPDTPKRFTSFCPCVLGSQGFTFGTHYWEVQPLQEGGAWEVGVAAETVNRKGRFTWSPEGGVWAVGGRNGQYLAVTSPETLLSPRKKPRKLGVYLDYEGGRLSLYNADSMELLYSFLQARFTQRLFPYFSLWGGADLRLV
ncbi:E3 ubiquitin-protein ligase TRIM39-like [Lissotriton helveticus]